MEVGSFGEGDGYSRCVLYLYASVDACASSSGLRVALPMQYPGDGQGIHSNTSPNTAQPHDSGVAEIRIQDTSRARDDGGRVNDPCPTVMSRVLKIADPLPHDVLKIKRSWLIC